jgi:methionine-gamma-lyase
MDQVSPDFGIGTLVNHAGEGNNPLNAHVTPLYQSSVFRFPDFAHAEAIYRGETQGYVYTRLDNPNTKQLELKYAMLEGLDLLRAKPQPEVEEVVAGKVFASGMAAISSVIMARARAGETVISQRALYSDTFGFLEEIATRLGIEVAWIEGGSLEEWRKVFLDRPKARLAYVETPVNPTMEIIDIEQVANLAHQHDCWLVVDNTFATPYAQRPLSMGADVVVHSITKYLSGHGVIIGGAAISRHPYFMREDLQKIRKRFGGTLSPFDAWLANMGLKTFELRMERHCQNAMAIAKYLASHPKVEAVYYPGLESHPGHAIAKRQMHAYGGMISFELVGGFRAARSMLEALRVAVLGVSLGCVDTLIQHPAGMTHIQVPPEIRRKMGISDGLIRLSVGIENVEDLIADFEQALEKV